MSNYIIKKNKKRAFEVGGKWEEEKLPEELPVTQRKAEILPGYLYKKKKRKRITFKKNVIPNKKK